MKISAFKTTVGLLVLACNDVSISLAGEATFLFNLTDADRTYINRGHSLAEAICLNAVIDEIDAYGGVESMKEFSINLDGETPTQIINQKAKIIHTCKDGKHVMNDSTGSYTLQVYDEDGNPMLETN